MYSSSAPSRLSVAVFRLDEVLRGRLPGDRGNLQDSGPDTRRAMLAAQFILEGDRRDQHFLHVRQSQSKS